MDAVVPVNQAESLVKAIRACGVTVQYELFDDEGHGWRKEGTIVAALEKEVSFYHKVLQIRLMSATVGTSVERSDSM
jgi:dipeptidyl aminopeptidase/acylaminoacyl peptidase